MKLREIAKILRSIFYGGRNMKYCRNLLNYYLENGNFATLADKCKYTDKINLLRCCYICKECDNFNCTFKELTFKSCIRDGYVLDKKRLMLILIGA